MMDGEFLPRVPVTTIVWAHADVELKWYAAQGDDLKNNIPAIELNLVKMVRDSSDEVEKVAQLLIDNWLALYVVLCTRQDLINKEARGLCSADGEQILYEANLKVINASRYLHEQYTRVAVGAIKGARTYIAVEGFADLFQRVLDHLDTKLALMEAEAELRYARAEKHLRDWGLLKGEP